MARTNKNLDIDLDYSKIKYDNTEDGRRVDMIDVDANEDYSGNSIAIAEGTSRRLTRKGNKKVKEHIGVSQRKKQSVLGTIIVCAILSVMLVMVVQGRVEMNETAKQISGLRNQLTKLESEEKSLSAKLEASVDMLEVENYIRNNGLVSAADVHKVYVGSSIDGSDDVDIYETEETMFTGTFATVLSAISDSFTQTWNTISGNE